MPAGLGGGGALGIAFETTMGTYVAPTIWVPILEEGLVYDEDKYYSGQIREQVIVSSVNPSYYSVGGDVTLEVDANFEPYFLYASRHTLAKSGAGPYVYTAIPSAAGSASTASGTTTPKTLSVTVKRNGVWFGYAGCTVGSFSYTIEDGVLRSTKNILGLSESTPGAPGTPAWVDPELFGADAHSIYLDTTGTAPAFGGAADTNFNGFTFEANQNASAQNRIRSDRSASYIAYGEIEATITSELDFTSKTDYDNMKANTQRAIQLRSLHGGSTLAASTDGLQITARRVSFDEYAVDLGAMGDLIMADFTGRIVGIAGAAPYTIECKSDVNIT